MQIRKFVKTLSKTFLGPRGMGRVDSEHPESDLNTPDTGQEQGQDQRGRLRGRDRHSRSIRGDTFVDRGPLAMNPKHGAVLNFWCSEGRPQDQRQVHVQVQCEYLFRAPFDPERPESDPEPSGSGPNRTLNTPDTGQEQGRGQRGRLRGRDHQPKGT